MKKFLLMAAALLSLAACEEKVEPGKEPGTDPVPPTPDEITITPETKSFGKDGGSQDVMVTSTAEWTLASEETYDWIEPSVLKGKDGDIVKFTAKENYTGKQLSAVFTFTCGEATAKFTVTSESGEVNTLELASDAKVDLRYTDKAATVSLNTNINFRAVEVVVPEEVKDWCKFSFPQEAGENQVNLVFTLEQNKGEQAREAVITIKGERVEPVTVTFSQRAEAKISTDKTEYLFEPDGGSIDVIVTSNVEYSFEVTEGAEWLQHSQKTVGTETLTADASNEKRTAKFVVSEKNPYPGDEPVKVEVIVRQAPKALVSHAIDMTQFRMRPSWEDGTMGTTFESFTVELLVKADELTKQISSIFGIEGYFLVRCGDVGIQPDNIHIAGGQIGAQWSESKGYFEGTDKILNEESRLNANQWYHIAVTAEVDGLTNWSCPTRVNLYINGELQAYGRAYFKPLNFAFTHQASWGGDKHKFYFGYSWDDKRDFVGKMAEVRIWKKALTSAELKAENHAYYVDPKSEGLVAYWKFNKSEMMTAEGLNQMCIPDETGHNYHMICETHEGNNEWTNKKEPKFVDVNLPE